MSETQNEQQKKSNHLTNAQRSIMLSFMEDHPELANDQIRNDSSYSVSAKALWAELTGLINRNRPQHHLKERSVAQVKEAWRNWVRSIKNLLSLNAQDISETGGGSHKKGRELTKLEEGVSALMNLKDAAVGLPGNSQGCNLKEVHQLQNKLNSLLQNPRPSTSKADDTLPTVSRPSVYYHCPASFPLKQNKSSALNKSNTQTTNNGKTDSQQKSTQNKSDTQTTNNGKTELRQLCLEQNKTLHEIKDLLKEQNNLSRERNTIQMECLKVLQTFLGGTFGGGTSTKRKASEGLENTSFDKPVYLDDSDTEQVSKKNKVSEDLNNDYCEKVECLEDCDVEEEYLEDCDVEEEYLEDSDA